MKKYIYLLLFALCFSMFGANAKEGLNNEITSKVSFFMTKKQLEDSIKRTPVDSVDNKDTQIYVYTDVNDMLNKENKFSSFMFADDMLISSVFMTPSTETEHKSILNSYMNFFKTTPESKLKKVENKKVNAVLYYNNAMLLLVYYDKSTNSTVAVTQLANDELINMRIDEIKNAE